MRTTAVLSVAGLCIACVVAASVAGQDAKPTKYSQNFDDVKAGSLPAGWKVDNKFLAGEVKDNAHEWAVQADPAAPSKPNVLSDAKINDPTGYSLCWTDKVSFKDGTITAKARLDSAAVDGSAGVAWRIVDARSYYAVRYNALEKNFRVYLFKDKKRIKLAEAAGIEIPKGTWFTIKVVAKGDKVECTLNDLKPITFTDASFAAGGVGFYVKQDAMASFDDLEVAGE